MDEYCAEFPSAVESVGTARRAIITFARAWFNGEGLTDIESAVGEALANCAEHGHRSGSAIEVRCRFSGEGLSIEIKDSGAGFDRWNASDYVRPLSNSPRGYGMFIMRELMDEIEYSAQGTRLRLVKRLPGAAAGRERRTAGG